MNAGELLFLGSATVIVATVKSARLLSLSVHPFELRVAAVVTDSAAVAAVSEQFEVP